MATSKAPGCSLKISLCGSRACCTNAFHWRRKRERERFGEEKWKGKGERAEREALVIRRYPGRRVLHGGIQRGGSGKWQLLWITGRGEKIYGKTLEIRSTKLPGCGGKIQRFLVADGKLFVGAVCFRFVKLHEREGNSVAFATRFDGYTYCIVS